MYPEESDQRLMRLQGDTDAHVAIPSVPCPAYPDILLAAPAYPVVAAAVRDFKPDIVHCETEFILGRLGQVAARRAGTPCVSSYHTDFGRYAAAYGVSWLRNPVSRYIARFHSRSARVYTPSAPAKADLARLGVSDVEVWGRGVDTKTFHPRQRKRRLPYCPRHQRQQAALPARGTTRGGERGRPNPRRVRARESLPAGILHLIVAGAGPEAEALRKSASRDVTFLGVLDREQMLPRVYASADACLFSSPTETLGLVVLEAMSSGLPVKATPADGVADHLRDDVNGLAFGANDTDAMSRAIVTLAMNPDLRAPRPRRAAHRGAPRHRYGARPTRRQLPGPVGAPRSRSAHGGNLSRHMCSPGDRVRFPLDPVI
jgi:phosphatidylinositol alpha 1,6-mannosyltransferase